ncbi:cell surface A33 antigen [Solea senegalensis]|nr:cell surface A33 antigen [Solea senegalensis]
MTTKRQLPWQKLFVILTVSVLPSCRSLEVSIPQAEYEVASGGDITLMCNFAPARPDFTTLVLRWEADPDNVDDPMKPVATFFLNTPVDIAPAYEGRATLVVDTDQRVGKLHLTKVTMKDSRRFQCSVLIPNDDEGTTIASTSLLVLVPPSPPICGIKGEAEYFHNISLTCVSEEGSPTPTYEWKSFTVENISRHFPPKTTEKDGVLSLFNISKETSGFFHCSSTNRIGTASCTLTLAVMPSSSNAALIAGIIVGVVAGVLIVGIIIFCCCRKKAQKAEYAEGAPGKVQFYDKDAPEAGEEYLDDKSKSETRQHIEYEDKDAAHTPKNDPIEPVGRKFEDDQHSQNSGRDRKDGHGSDVDSQRNRENQRDHNRGSRDHLDEQRDNYRGSRDRLEEQRDTYRGSRDRLDEPRDHYRGSRDRLDEPRDHYRGSRDRLDEPRDHYRGSRDRLDEPRDHYRGSRDRLDDQRDQYHGSRDRLDEKRDQYRGSSDRLDYRDDQYRD